MASAASAWANPYALHPWFKMPSHKRKDLSSDEEDTLVNSPVRGASYEPRRSLSPAPSPKRRRCDVLENGMSQLTLDGRPIPPSSAHYFAPGQFPPPHLDPAAAGTPTILFPVTPTTSNQSAAPLWADGPQVTATTAIPASVVLPGSVEEPTSPEASGASIQEDADVQDVSMKVPSWYEIEKDRTSSSPSSSAPATAPASTRRPLFRRAPRPTVVDDGPSADAGIVITDLEDSDAEDTDGGEAKSSDGDAPGFTISSALLDRLPKPSVLGALAPDATPTNALVLYRPLPLPMTSEDSTEKPEEDTPRIEEVVREDEPIAEDTEMPVDEPIDFTPIVDPVGLEPTDEPMDIEML